MKQLNSVQYAEQFLQSIDQVLEQRLSQMTSDKTVIGTIVAIDKDNANKYQVSSDNIVFWAYSNTDTVYNIKTQVYVLIPDGDYGQEKIIISTVPREDKLSLSRSSNRFKSFVKMSKVFSYEFGPTETVEYDKNSINPFYYNAGYNAIGIVITPKENIQLTPEDYFNTQILFTKLNNEGTDEQEKVFLMENPIVITNQDLRGNLYNLSPSIKYEFIYDCPIELQRNLVNLNSIKIINNSSFSSSSGNLLKVDLWMGYANLEEQLGGSTQQLKIYSNKDREFGDWIEENEVILQEYDKTIAQINAKDDITKDEKDDLISETTLKTSTALKNINIEEHVTYSSKDEDIKLYLEAFGEGISASFYDSSDYFSSIDIYIYEIGAYDEILGQNWRQIGYYAKDLASQVLKPDNWILDPELSPSTIDLGLGEVFLEDMERTRLKIVCKVRKEGSDEELEFVSDELVYYNANKDTPAISVMNDDLQIVLSDGNPGIYNYYGLDNNLRKNPYDVYSVRVQSKDGTSLMEPDGKSYNKDMGIQRIKWEYPTYLTGIEPKYKYDSTGKKTNEIEGLLTSSHWGDTFYYTLKNQCYPTYTNNIIRCIVYYRNGDRKEASISLTFGGYGNRSTPYSLNINMLKEEKSVRVGETVQLEGTIERTDGENSVVSKVGWIWSLMDPNTSCKFVDEAKMILGDGKTYTTTKEDEKIYLSIPETVEEENYKLVVKLTIPKVQINDISETDLVSYFPIPLNLTPSSERVKYKYAGPDRVVYDGLNESSYDDATIQLLKNNKPLTITGLEIMNEENIVSGVYEADTNNQFQGSHLLCYASAESVKNKNLNDVKLVAATGILINSKPYVNTVSIYINNGQDEKVCVWKQPIITFRNNWESSIYNWNGKEPTTLAEGFYSPFIAAGKKESDNSFTGVMLGGVSNGIDPEKKTYGIFGTKKGQPRFYFNENGEVYMGNAEKSYGITLNSDGELNMRLNQYELWVPHMRIDSDNTFIGLYTNDDNTEEAIYIGYDNNDKIPEIRINAGGYFTIVDEKNQETFKAENGNLTISGTINAKSGSIGQWRIYDNIFQNENWYLDTSDLQWDNDNSFYNLMSIKYKIRLDDNSVYGNGYLQELYASSQQGSLVHQGGLYVYNEGWQTSQPTSLFVFSPYGYETIYDEAKTEKNDIIDRLTGTIGPTGIIFKIIGGGADEPSARIFGGDSIKNKLTFVGTLEGETTGGSDYRLKNNIIYFNEEERFEQFYNNLKPCSFEYNDAPNKLTFGFIAQDILQNFEKMDIGLSDQKLVSKSNETNMYLLNYIPFIALNTWQIQKLKTQVLELEKEIKELKQHEIY